MAPTTSQGRPRRREAGWGIKRPSRKCGGCAGKVSWRVPGDLPGVRPRRKSPDSACQEAAGHPTGVSRGCSSGGIVRRDGPNAKPRQGALAEVTAASPVPAVAGPHPPQRQAIPGGSSSRGGNLAAAPRSVERNAGARGVHAPGVDGMRTKELRSWPRDHWPEIRPRSTRHLLTGRPGGLRSQSPPGGERGLEVSTALDRMIQ